MLFLKPDKVRALRLNHDKPVQEGVYFHPIDPDKISNRGILAKTEFSSREAGELLFTHICDQIERIATHSGSGLDF
jgi:hypothetical protein